MSKTVLHRLAAWADSEPNTIGQRYRVGNQWKNISVREYCNRVYWMALFLESQGFTSKDVGAILSYNCPEWVHLDLAAILTGGKSAGIYPNSTQKDILYVLEHAEARFLSVQNAEYFKKIVGDQGEKGLPEQIKLVIVFDQDTSFSSKAISYEKALAQGKTLAEKKGAKSLQEYLGAIHPDSDAFMIYTSGTTGRPKGAILSHDNLVYTIDQGVKFWGLKAGNGSLFSFLPLCHIAEKVQNIGGGICLRYTVSFCSKFENVSIELPQVEPTLLLCVPRLWEKMMEGVQKKLSSATGVKKLLADQSFQIGARISEKKYAGEPLSLLDQLQWKFADRMVLSKVRKALGLSRAETLASGAAALAPHVSRWFQSLGLEIIEVFGQTESTGIICMTEPHIDSVGTVGKPVPGMEFKLAEDGEILTRGRHVFKCYHKDPASTQTTVDAEGWLHTGDLGERDQHGRIKIRGRKKEILKTSGGKMVAPVPIEEQLKAAPMISQVCIVGDGRKHLSALITLSEAKMAELLSKHGQLKDRVVQLPEVVGEVQTQIDTLNASLASFEQIKKFAVLSKEFAIDTGEMTPTLKMKRSVIEARYQDLIEGFYS